MTTFERNMICFSGGNSFIQRAIRYFTKCDFSHSFVTMNGPNNIICALETTSTIVCLSPTRVKYSEKNYVECWRLVDPGGRQALEINSNLAFSNYAGHWYGYLSYIWFIYRWIMRNLKIEPKKMWDWCNSGITCTELTLKSFPYSDLLPEGRDDNTFAPKELHDIVVKNKHLFEFVGWINEDYLNRKK